MNETEENIVDTIDPEKLDGGLEILVELAEKGDIDPWDLDIIDVTNKYLAALNQTPRENLLNAGRAIFYASVLLRLKSEILLNISSQTLVESQEEDFFPEDEMMEEEVHIDIGKLDKFINRSSLGKHQRKRKIILDDLITALQDAQEEEERKTLRAKIRAERRMHTIIAPDTPDDVMDMAHEEDIEDIVERIESIIEEHLTDEQPITLEYLATIIDNKVKPFLSLLFMAHANKIVVEQDGPYGEIHVYKKGSELANNIEKERADTVAKEMKEYAKILKEEKKKKKKRKLGQKVKDKIKDVASKIKDKVVGNKEEEPEVLEGETNSEPQAKATDENNTQTIIMNEEKENIASDEEAKNV